MAGFLEPAVSLDRWRTRREALLTRTGIRYGLAWNSLQFWVLALISFLPTFAIVFLQFLSIGYSSTLGGSLPFSDSSGWAACSSALASSGISENLDWCLRRPVAVTLMAPIFVLTGSGLASGLVLQGFLIGVAQYYFLTYLRHYLAAPFSLVVAIGLVMLWPIFSYGFNYGPEGITLALSLAGAAGFLRFLTRESLGSGLVTVICVILGLQARPGNVVLAVWLLVCVSLLLFFRASKRLASLAVAGVGLLTWILPNRIWQSLGFPDAGHSANFWATLYTVVTPEKDGWPETYARFAEEASALGPETKAFSEVLSGATRDLFLADPLVVLTQTTANLQLLWERGVLNLLLSTPNIPVPLRQLLPNISQYTGSMLGVLNIYATALWVLSAIFVLLLVVAVARILTSEGLARGSDVDSSVKWVAAVAGVTSLMTLAGLVAFFLFVGHDEATRHMVQSIPFVVIGVPVALLGVRMKLPASVRQERSVSQKSNRRRVYPLIPALLVVLAVVSMDAMQGAQKVAVSLDCSEPDDLQLGSVVAAVSVAGDPRLDVVYDYRTRQGNPYLLLEVSNWITPELASLPTGNLIALRMQGSGDIKKFFADDQVTEAIRSGSLPPLCRTARVKGDPWFPLGFDALTLRSTIQ